MFNSLNYETLFGVKIFIFTVLYIKSAVVSYLQRLILWEGVGCGSLLNLGRF